MSTGSIPVCLPLKTINLNLETNVPNQKISFKESIWGKFLHWHIEKGKGIEVKEN